MAAIHINPFVFFALQTDLYLLKIGEIIDLAKVGKPFLRSHAQRVDRTQRIADVAVYVLNARAIPNGVRLVNADRLEYLNMISQQ